ncbi:MAG: putative lipopolysaccharide heptosyltransferase III [Abitibacteriaceae bacterium]|nr:putative lipopolysaccharide heptosyltransferase III [Abditibacteriaceae bacterium]
MNKSSPRKEDAPRILVIRFRFIGDVLLVTPVFEALRRHWPHCYLAFVTDAEAAAVVEGHPALDELMVFRLPKKQLRSRWARLQHKMRLFQHMRQQHFDIAINLHPGQRGALTAWLSGARRRVGYDRPQDKLENALTNIKVPYRLATAQPREYRVEYLLDTVRALGIEAKATLPSMGLSYEDRAFATSYLKSLAFDRDGPLIVLHPGRPSTRKTWPDGRFTQLADALSQRFAARIIWLGAPAEVERVKRIAGAMTHTSASVAGQANLKQLAAIIEQADLFIGIDSGPMHIASAVGTPTVALFAFADPNEWNPPGATHIAIHKPLPDHPCDPPQCCEVGKSLCMANIYVNDVLAAAERLLNKGE